MSASPYVSRSWVVDPHDPARRDALRLIRNLGVPYNARRSADWFAGATINAGAQRKLEDTLHDAAHWVVAAPARRLVVDFGLGPVPSGETPKGLAPVMVRGSARDHEEVLASGLGIMFLAWAGAEPLRVAQNFRDHCWPTTARAARGNLDAAMRRARRRGVEVPPPVRELTDRAYSLYQQS